MMRESLIEKELISKVKVRGGMALKFVSPGMSGVPDRLILLPGGIVAFIEVKASSKLMRPLQIKRKRQLEALGFQVYMIDDKKLIGGVLNDICST